MSDRRNDVNLRADSRVVIVTGTAGGIGSAIAEAFESLGDTVVGLDLEDGFDVRDPESCRGAQHFNALSRQQMPMAGRLELTPIRTVMPIRPAICAGHAQKNEAARFDESGHRLQRTPRIVHMLETMMGHDELIPTRRSKRVVFSGLISFTDATKSKKSLAASINF